MTVLREADHRTRALSRLTEQFKDRPRILALISLFAEQVQSLEDAFWDLLTLRAIPVASGVYLDRLGTIVGQARGATIDALYRTYILARVKVNRSSGTIPELLEIFTFLNPTATIRLVESFPAGQTLHIEDLVLSSATASAMANFLKSARAAAVYANLEWFPQGEASSLIFDSTDAAQKFDSGRFIGALSA